MGNELIRLPTEPYREARIDRLDGLSWYDFPDQQLRGPVFSPERFDCAPPATCSTELRLDHAAPLNSASHA